MHDRLTGPSFQLESVSSVSSQGLWLPLIRRYLLAIAVGNLVWEFAQLPLYTIWRTGTAGEIVFAAVHCTGGDILIAATALVGALVVAGHRSWPLTRYRTVAVIAVVAGLLYTIFSEWMNTEVRGTWAYTELMPRIPPLGSGLAPIAQWLIIPPLAFWWARRSWQASHVISMRRLNNDCPTATSLPETAPEVLRESRSRRAT